MYIIWHVEKLYHVLKILNLLSFDGNVPYINQAYKILVKKEQPALSYSFFQSFVGYMERKGLVTTEKKGRNRMVKITEKGKKLLNLLEQVNSFDLAGKIDRVRTHETK